MEEIVKPVEELENLNLQQLINSIENEQEETDDDYDDGEETVEEVETTEGDVTEVDTDNATEIDTETDDNKQVPLAKLIDERKKRQEKEAEVEALKIQLNAVKGDTEDAEITQYRQSKIDKYEKMGYDNELATSLADDLTEVYKMSKSPKTETNPIDKDTLEIVKLKSESEYYDNADSFTDKIKENMKKYSITAKQAYNMIVDPTIRQNELAQRKLVTPKEQTSTAVIQSNGGKSEDAQIKLSNADREALKLLQTQFPHMNWTAKKMLESRNKQK